MSDDEWSAWQPTGNGIERHHPTQGRQHLDPPDAVAIVIQHLELLADAINGDYDPGQLAGALDWIIRQHTTRKPEDLTIDAEPGDPVTHWPASVESSDETLNAVGGVPDCETIAEQIHEEYRATEVGSALPGWPDYYYRDEFAAAVEAVVGPILTENERLRGWKREATEVLKGWEDDVTSLVRFKSSDLGRSESAVVADRIAELEQHADAADEIERLKGWKADALRVIEGWDAVFDMVPRKSEHLGRSKSDVVSARIAELEAGMDHTPPMSEWPDPGGADDDR